MTKYAMAIDLERCIGCGACTVACKAEHGIGAANFRLRVGEVVFGDQARPFVETLHAQCYHCEKPLCVPVCPTGATYVDRLTGTVQIDPDRCSGCKACVVACPYGMRHVDPDYGFIDKCSFCVQRNLDGQSVPGRVAEGLLPACVDVCPSQARIFGDLDDAISPISQLLANPATRRAVDRPEIGLRPKLFFVGSRYEGRRT
jgi:tetrathionate reductase subunit B